AMLTLKDPQNESRGLADAFGVGCAGRIMQLQHVPEGYVNVVIQTLKRFQPVSIIQHEPYPVVRIQPLEDIPGEPDVIAPLATTVKRQMARLIELSPDIPEGAAGIVQNIEDAGFLADLVAGNLNISTEEKQALLGALDRRERLEKLIRVLAREVELLEVSNKIQSDVKSSIDKGQREFFLRQQLKAIQEELGEGEAQRPELGEYRKKIEALGMPEEAKKEAERELTRLSQMNDASAEYHVITTYLDWMTELPWSSFTEDQLDIDRAENILNEDHYGLEKVKKRILEYLAVRKLKPDAAGPILCFFGPPGVGKTSLGRSIARALDRKFVRMSLGGMHDEAEIRGHRKTYVGALPGRIIQNIRKAGSRNPVFMLDEIDKVGADFRGDPSSALLEVLDPAQNDTFTDLYLGVPFDLSRVLFIATANVIDTIPWALRDRMEVIELRGYTLEEKVEIARRYLVPRQIDANGLTGDVLSFSATALRTIISSYTRESGVRNLEREIANVCRGCAREYAQGKTQPRIIKPEDLHKYLGREKFFYDAAERTSLPGVAIGLAWTPTGGDILFIEATRMPGKGNLILTGQLGDVMKESAQACLSYVRANASKLNIPNEEFEKSDIHIHVPAGAVPKDGPSAGVTLLAALVSLLTGKRVKSGLAMTGEITLRGLVLPVGGIKEKVLGASRAGIKEVILPERSQEELEDVPLSVKRKMKFYFVKRMSEVLDIAIGVDV
ncbi:MAG: endopeptidase La, partial [Candidatus Hydrogenedentes bacterium]|nr:endopeptidase La [Candidatus Hydrogenedentota bacterium]